MAGTASQHTTVRQRFHSASPKQTRQVLNCSTPALFVFAQLMLP
jgi:hypothetical protein